MSENLAAVQNEPPGPPPFADQPIFDSDEALRRLNALDGDDAPTPAAPPPPSEATPAEDAAPPEQEATGEDQGTDPENAPPLDPPRSWSKEARDRWSKLDRDTQEYLLNRDREDSATVRRTQNEIAEARKALDAEKAAIAQERQQWQTNLQPVLQSKLAELQNHPFAKLSPQERAQLRATDPARFVDLKDDFDMREREAATAFQAHQQLQARAAQEMQQRQAKFLEEQQALLAEKAPEFVNEKTGPALKAQASSYLKDVGFNDQELSGLIDHRLLLVVRDALRGREAANKTAIAQAKVAGVKPVAKPGAAKSQPGMSHQKRTALLDGLSKAGSDAAQAAILDELGIDI